MFLHSKLDMLHVEATKYYKGSLNTDKKFLDVSYCNQNRISEDNLSISRTNNIIRKFNIKCTYI